MNQPPSNRSHSIKTTKSISFCIVLAHCEFAKFVVSVDTKHISRSLYDLKLLLVPYLILLSQIAELSMEPRANYVEVMKER